MVAERRIHLWYCPLWACPRHSKGVVAVSVRGVCLRLMKLGLGSGVVDVLAREEVE